MEYITNIRMQAVGLPLPFGARSNPIPWINAGNVQVAPQEVEVSSYLVGQIPQSRTNDFGDFDLSEITSTKKSGQYFLSLKPLKKLTALLFA